MVNDRFENCRLLTNAVLNRLLTQPQCMNDNSSSIKSLHDTTQECLLSLQNMDINIESWDPILLHILVQRLSKSTHTLWEQSLEDPKQLPSLEDFLKFLRNRFHSLEVLGAKVSQSNSLMNSSKGGICRALTVTIPAKQRCVACKDEHPIYKCPNFIKMTTNQRLNIIQRSKHCVNCLRSGHSSKTCSSGTCSICHKKHNTLLHLDIKKSGRLSNDQSSAGRLVQQDVHPATTISQDSVALTAVQKVRSIKVLLSTISVSLEDKWGQAVQCRAILDSGSQANFITKRLAIRLGLQRGPCLVDVEGIGQSKGPVAERVNIKITSNTSAFTKNIDAHILSEIVSDQPSQDIDFSNWKIPSNIQLADPTFHKSQKIDFLIGAGVFFTSLFIGQISLGEGLPVLQNSMFGWLVGGECNYNRTNSPNDAVTCGVCTEDEALNDFGS